jgi:hypothetical protein
MPDQDGTHSRHGRRLYAERMIAIGVSAPHLEPQQSTRDYAFDLLNRIIEEHCGPRWASWHSLLLGYLALGLAIGVVIGVALIAPVVWR